jgi:hypothetical protein
VGPAVFDIFLELSKPTQILKLKMDALLCPKNSQILHSARLGNYEQLSLLCRHPNLNRCRVKIPGIDSQFEFLVNFQRGLILLENSDKFPKNPSRYGLHKSEFSWDLLHVRKGVTIHASNGVV